MSLIRSNIIKRSFSHHYRDNLNIPNISNNCSKNLTTMNNNITTMNNNLTTMNNNLTTMNQKISLTSDIMCYHFFLCNFIYFPLIVFYL